MFIFGDIDNNLKYLIFLVIIDFLIGIFCSYITKQKNNSIGLKGIIIKFCYFVIVAISVILGNIMDLGLSLRTIVVHFFIYTEIVSILNNCKNIGITKLPSIFTDILEKFKHNTEKNNQEINKKEE